MEKFSNAATVITVLALLLTVKYSFEPYDSWDSVLAIAAGIVFWKTREEWIKDRLISALVSVGIGTLTAILCGVLFKSYKIVRDHGAVGLISSYQHFPARYQFIDKEMLIAALVAITIFGYTRWKSRS